MNQAVMERPGQASPYWEMVHTVQRDLNENAAAMQGVDPALKTVFITSIENWMRGIKGGRVIEASSHLAAQRIVDRTHQLSIVEEIKQYKAERQADVDLFARREEARKQTMSFRPTQEENERTAAVVAAAVAAAVTQPGGKKKEATT